MSSLLRKCRPSGPWATALAGLLAAGLAAAPARAAEAARPAESLKWVPADAAFYGAMLRAGEQVQAIAKSRAWAKFQEMPWVQFVWRQLLTEYSEEGRLAPVYNFFQKPENRELLALVGDMFSREVFVYGGPNWPEFISLMEEVTTDVRFAPLFAQLGGEARGQSSGELQLRALVRSLVENRKSLKTPDMVLGFRLSKPARAEAQLKRLEKLINDHLKDNPRLKGLFKREKVGGASFLTLRLEGKLVPWDQIPLKDYEENDGDADALVKVLKEMRLTVAVGVRDGFLLVSLGETTAPLVRMGRGKLLADRPELKPLARFAGKPFTSISYASRALQERTTTSAATLSTWGNYARQLLAQAPLTEQQKAEILKDLRELGKEIKPFLPRPGAVLSFSFLTGRGYEGYVHDWGEYPDRDGSRPLPLLRHAGGSPLLVTVARSKGSQEQYRVLVKAVRIGFKYFEEYAVPHIEDKEKYEQVKKEFLPLVRRLGRVTERSLLPALADGQAGLVLDAKITSKQWFRGLPESDTPLPMLEPALVLGVSDAAKLRQAFREYRSIANELLAKLHAVAPDEIPEHKIPPPKAEKVKDGTLYFYPLSEDLGVDRQLSPNAGLSDKVAVLTVAMKHSQRLLADTPLKVRAGPLADLDRNLADATYVNWAGLVKAATPWVNFALQNVPEEADRTLGGLRQQVQTLLDVLQVFRSYASVTYQEDGAWVTHSETVIRDLPAK